MATYPPGALSSALESMTLGRGPTLKVVVMVCVSEHDDCGRHICLVVDGGRTKQRYCSVQPVWCWRCVQRQGGIPDFHLVKVSEVESRFSTLLSWVQLEFGQQLTYPAGYTAEEFEAEGAGDLFAGLSKDDVVGTVEVLTPMNVEEYEGVTLPPLKVGALGDDGMFLPDGAPQDFIGPGSASDCLTWVGRAQEVGEWTTQLGEYPSVSTRGVIAVEDHCCYPQAC